MDEEERRRIFNGEDSNGSPESISDQPTLLQNDGLSKKTMAFIKSQEKVCPQCGGGRSSYIIRKGVVTILCPDCRKERFYNISEIEKLLKSPSKLSFLGFLGKKGYNHVKERHGHKIRNLIIFIIVVGLIILGLNLYSQTTWRGADAAGDIVGDTASIRDNPIVNIFSFVTEPLEGLFSFVGDSSKSLWVYWTDPLKWDDQGELDRHVKKTDGENYNAVEIYKRETGQNGIMSVSKPTSYLVAYQNLGTQTPKELYVTLSLGDSMIENGGFIRPRGTVEGEKFNDFYESYTPTRAVINVSRMPVYYGKDNFIYDIQMFKIRSPVCSDNFPLDLNIRYEYETSMDWDPQFLAMSDVDRSRQQGKDDKSLKELQFAKAASGPVDIVVYSLMDQIIIEANDDGTPHRDESDVVYLKFGLVNYREGIVFVNDVVWRIPDFLEVVEDGSCGLVKLYHDSGSLDYKYYYLDEDGSKKKVDKKLYELMDDRSGYLKYVPLYFADSSDMYSKSIRVMDGNSIDQRKAFFCSFRYNAKEAKKVGLSLPAIVHIDSRLTYSYEFSESGSIKVDPELRIGIDGLVKCDTDLAMEKAVLQWNDAVSDGELSRFAQENGLPYGDVPAVFKDFASYEKITIHNDYAGLPRVFQAQKK